MLDFLLSHTFYVLWGLALGLIGLLIFVTYLKKDAMATNNHIKDVIDAELPKINAEVGEIKTIATESNQIAKDVSKSFEEFKVIFIDGRQNLHSALCNIQDKQSEILERLHEHDEKLCEHDDNMRSGKPMEIDVDAVAKDFAKALGAKIKEKKVDKYK